MAISKTQPMRPAEIELVNTVNANTVTLANHTQAIADLTTNLDSEISTRAQADITINGRIDAEIETRSQADLLLNGDIANEINQRIAGDNDIKAIIGDGFSAQNTVANALAATNLQVSLLNDDLNDVKHTVSDIQSDLVDVATDVANLLLFEGRIQIGNVTDLTIPANDSISGITPFPQPFDSGSNCIVFAQVITSETPTLFTFTLIGCTYSSFSYNIANSDADAHTVSLGYVAIRTSA